MSLTLTDDAAKIAEALSTIERRWLTGWDGPEGAAYNAVATNLRRKGLLIGPYEWNLSPLGIAVRNKLKGQSV